MKNPELIETIIYGGAFNPPTLAHLAILQACIDYARPRSAEVWIMPSGNRSDKTINVDNNRRLDYVGAMMEDVDAEGVPMSIITDELTRKVSVETFDTFLEMNGTYPNREFVWVFGADSTETMGDWYNGPWLLENLSMLVLERDGYKINPLAKRAMALTIPHMNISSTDVRNGLAAGLDVSQMLSPRVNNLVHQNV